MFLCKMISILCVIFVSLISSTNSSSEETHIGTIVEAMKEFLQEVKKMDRRLQDPDLLKKFDELKKKFWGIFNMKNKWWRFGRFKKEYAAFVDYTEKCLNDYTLQINAIVQWDVLGNKDTRNAFLEYYNDKFIKKMKLKGYSDEEGTLKKLHKRLSDALQNFYYKIAELKYPPPAPIFIIPEGNYEVKQHKDHSHSSHSHSHSGGVSAGDVAVPLIAAGGGLIIGAELGELAAEHKHEEEKQEEVKHIEENHESSSSSASSAAEENSSDHAVLESGGGGGSGGGFEEAFDM